MKQSPENRFYQNPLEKAVIGLMVLWGFFMPFDITFETGGHALE